MAAYNEKVEMADFQRPSPPGIQDFPRRMPRRSFLQKMRKRIYLFSEYPSPIFSLIYHIVQCLLCLLLVCLGLVYQAPPFRPFEGLTIPEFGPALIGLETLLLAWLLPELVLRVWSSGCRKRFQGWRGILVFFSSFLLIIDVASVLIAIAILALGVRKVKGRSYSYSSDEMYYSGSTTPRIIEENPLGFADVVIPPLLFLQIIRLCKFARLFGGSRLIIQVAAEKSRVLLTYSQIGLLGFFVFPYFVYLCEMGHDYSSYRNYTDALWWGIVTLTTVGYGDMRPISFLGRAFGGLTAFFGCLVFFMPAIVIGIGLQQKVKEDRVHRNSRKNPAVALIQSKWRLHRLGGGRHNNIPRAIQLMKFLAAQKKLKETKKQMSNNGNEAKSGNSHERICSLESRLILMEKSMEKVLEKVGALAQRRRIQ